MTALSPTDPLGLISSVLENKYRVDAFVAEGGFSLVYQACHVGWNQPVAIKFLTILSEISPGERESLLQSFLQEGALLRELSSRSASVVQAYDLGAWTTSQGVWYPYLVLEWLDGKPLDLLLEQHRRSSAPPWSLERCMRLLEPVVKAFEIMHRRGVVHRDLKPANLFVLGDIDSDEAFLKVLDFGIAKVVQDVAHLQASSAKTGLGFSSFTPQYGAPEQFSRSMYGATGPWTDVYAFALVMVEMMTFAPPLPGDDLAQLAFATTNPNQRPTPRHAGAHLSDAVENVFKKAVALQPADRFASVAEFWNALRQAVGQSPLDAATPPHQPSSSHVPITSAASNASKRLLSSSSPGPRPRKTLSLVVTLVGLAVAGIVAAGFLFFKPPHDPATNAVGATDSVTSQASVSPTASASVVPRTLCPPDMVAIPGGPFFMGYEGDGATDGEKPVHAVRVSPFCMEITEVTVEAYRACSDEGKCPRASVSSSWPGATPREKKIYSPLCNAQQPGRDRHPINCVSWEAASTYCTVHDRRLPTSAEWEFAVRGPDGRVYPWGDDPPDANHLNACGVECVKWGKEHGESLAPMHTQDDGFAATAPVGSFPKGRSRYGLDDVIGNVMEWVWDWDGPYAKTSEPAVDPKGPAEGTERVIRGGAWNAGHLVWVRPSFRFRFHPETKSHAIGFRCAVTVEPKP